MACLAVIGNARHKRCLNNCSAVFDTPRQTARREVAFGNLFEHCGLFFKRHAQRETVKQVRGRSHDLPNDNDERAVTAL
jgi:hypothetical protein